MKVTIAKVDETLFDGEAESLTVPAVSGEMTILGEHMPLITTLKGGTVTVRGKNIPDEKQFFEIKGGVLEVRQDGVTIVL